MVKHPKSLLSLVYKFKTNFKIMFIQKFVEVPNTDIKQEILPNQYEWDICYSLAQEFGHAQVVWYALNGKRVLESEYELN